VSGVARWDVELDMEYVLVDGPGGREESAVVEDLNEALGRGERSDELFGPAPPVVTTWTFDARDLTTNAAVPVVVGPDAGPAQVRVEMSPEGRPGEKIRVFFPAQTGHVYRLQATSRSQDAFGSQGEKTHVLWNAAISAEDAERLFKAMLVPLAAEAALDVDALRELVRAPADAGGSDADKARRRNARILWGRGLRAASDNQVTAAELGDLLSLARMVRK